MKKFSFLAAGAAALMSCVASDPNSSIDSLESELTATEIDLPPSSACASAVTPIYAGKRTNVGSLTISNTPDEVVLNLALTGTWTTGLAHVYVGHGAPPANNHGIVVPGKFPFHYELQPSTQTAEFRIPFNQIAALCGDELTVAVHLEVVESRTRREETAWAYGDKFEGARWGWSFDYALCCPVPECGCAQTAEYWTQNPAEWAAQMPTVNFGGVTYTQDDLLALLALDPSSDPSIALVQQLVAMKLNHKVGEACLTDEEWLLLHGSQSWLYPPRTDADGTLPYSTDPSTSEGQLALELAASLMLYNAGELGVPACE